MREKIKKNYSVDNYFGQADEYTYLIFYLHIWEKFLLKNCIGICTDGKPYMVDSIKCFVTLVKVKIPMLFTHYFTYKEILRTKCLGNELQKVFDGVIKMVNSIIRK